MNTTIFRNVMLLSIFLATTGSVCAADNWIPLFDGSTLDGWIQRGGKANYTVEDGVIVGTTVPNTPNSFLCTEKNYGDFILDVDFKVSSKMNSGIQFRSNSLPEYRDGRVHGYQCEIDPSDRAWTGGIYDEGRRGWLDSHIDNSAARYAFKPGEWNQFRIQAVGDSIRTWLNGVAAADLKDDLTATGFIALQVHGVGNRTDPLTVRWRNIRIREIADGKIPVTTESQAAADNSPVVPDDAKVRKLADGFVFTEGPAEGPDGRLYFSDIPNSRTHVYDPATDKVSVFREETGRANGMMFAPSGSLFFCEGGSRKVTRMFEGDLTVVADSFNGKKLNSPNDIELDNDGGLYFTDPRYGNRDDMELDVEGVYYLPRGRKPKLKQVVSDLVRPNGIILSLDQKTLYVVDNGAKTVVAYDVPKPGVLENPRLFAEMDMNQRGGGDGMTIDSRGNIYCAGQGQIWIWNPDGKVLHRLDIPEGPANCAFGGKDRKTLYITARTSLYAIDLNVAGGR